MKSDLLNFLSQYKKEITVAIIGAVATLLFTKALPALLSLLRNCGSYLLAVFTGNRKDYKFEKKYLAWLINQNKYLVNVPSRLLTPEHLPKQPELESAFIQLHLKRSNEAPVELAISELVKPGAKTVILGDPGSGKTTQLRYFCLTYARIAKMPFFFYTERRLLTSRFQATGNRIPILIYLNRLTESDHNLLAAAERALPESLSAIYPHGYFQRLLENGKCIILLDGLDEVPTTGLRKQVAETISSLSNATNERNTWVASSRIVGYTTQLHNTFETAIVKALTFKQVEGFVESWYRIKCDTSGFPDSELAIQREVHAKRARNLVNTIKLNPGLTSLATSPILVSLIALLHSVKIELPQSRPLLYRDCVELLADRWDLSRGLKLNLASPILLEQKIHALMSIASHMHNERLPEVSRSELETIVSSQVEKLFKGSDYILPAQIIDDLEERSGLLINRGLTEAGEKVMAFSHLSFQEYLTARSLLSNPRSNAKEMLSEHFADSWWREAILLYVAQMESPRSLIEDIYIDSFNDKSVEKLLLAAACLSEVKQEKTDDLYMKIFTEIAFIYSCSEIKQLTLFPLECDTNNMLLRHMVDYLLRTTPQQAKGLEMLLKVKRNVELSPELFDQFVAEYESVPEVVDYDLRMVKAISKHRTLPTTPVLSMMFRSPDSLNKPDEISLSEPITTQQLGTTAIAQPDWRIIFGKLVSLAPHAVVDGKNQQSDDWKQLNVARLILKNRFHFQELQSDRSEESLDKIKDCLAQISDGDYARAEEIYRSVHGWVEPQIARQCQEDIQRVFNSVDAPGRRLCVMLVLHFRQIENCCAQILIDFVTQTRDSFTRTSDSNPHEKESAQLTARLQDMSLTIRAINSLSEYRFTKVAHVRFLTECLESDVPEIIDFAASSIARLEGADHETLALCDNLLKSSHPSKLWAGVLLSSSTKASEGSFVEKLLPQLYDKEAVFREKSVADHAAYSMLKILSNVVTPSTH